MSKVRVYELARELKIESRLLLAKMKDLGISVSSHQSALTEVQVLDIRKAFKGEVEPENAKKASPKVIRRRKVAAPTAKVEPAPPSEVSEGKSETIADKTADVKVAVSEVNDLQSPTEEKVSPSVEVGEAKSGPVKAEPEEAVKVDAQGLVKSVSEKIEPEAQATPSLNDIAKKDEKPEDAAGVNGETGLKKDKPSSVPASGGATIVRRATPDEVASRRAAAVKATESRGGRPRRTGGAPSGHSARPGEARAEASRESGQYNDKDSSRGGRASRDSSRGKEVASAQMPLVDPGGAPWKEGSGRRDKKRGIIEKDATPVRRTTPVKKRDSVNMRSLLDGADRRDDDKLLSRKRTVYTPAASARANKRDLKRRKDLKKTQITTPRAAYRVVKMADNISVAELGKQMSVKGAELIKKLMGQGVMVTLNQSIDFDTASLIASDYGFEVQSNKVSVDDILTTGSKPKEEAMVERPPIVTIMGHVDHGKTSILDAIRKAKVADGEAGGITQHIGAYSVKTNAGKLVAFLDTPGHAAFSAMRQRGAKVTDIVVLVVAADDGVMPQTVEAISHAKEAGVPIIVAVNKIDKPNINLDRVYTELTEHGIQSEEWGGDTQFVKVSALERTGLDDLLDAISLQAEVLELKADPTCDAECSVVEAHLDTGRGPVATLMVTAGTLRVGDLVVAGTTTGRVRAMQDHLGQKVAEAMPSTPVEIVGLEAVPMAGDQVNSVSDEKTARGVVDLRVRAAREAASNTSSAATLEKLLGQMKSNETPEVPVIIKADTQGSAEAIVDSISKLNSERVRNKVVHKAVGGISESDIRLAATSGALIIGFNVRMGRGLDDIAEKFGVPVKYFGVIYDVVDAIKAVMAGRLPPIRTEVVQGHGEVRQTIKVPKIGIVAGTAIMDGKITRHSYLRLIRDAVVIFEGKIGSLRRFKDDVKEVASGYECGVGIEGYNDVREGDVIESYIVEESAATL